MTPAPLVALAVDRVLGEPPPRAHPVVWMGHYCTWAGRRLRGLTGRRTQVDGGALAVAGGVAASAAAAAVTGRLLRRLPRAVGLLLEGALLSMLLSVRMLEREVTAVDAALQRGVTDGRRAVARLVSRDVTHLDAVAVREAALESLAENASDSVVAPLWWYALAGLPGAAAYRFVNTADAMWGYRTAIWRWRGCVAARVDDLANWWPARLTALLLAPRVRGVGGVAAATDSPNAGWPMGALALLLDVRLGKPGVYLLHAGGGEAGTGHIPRARRVVRRAALLAAGAAAVLARATAGSPATTAAAPAARSAFTRARR